MAMCRPFSPVMRAAHTARPGTGAASLTHFCSSIPLGTTSTRGRRCCQAIALDAETDAQR